MFCGPPVGGYFDMAVYFRLNGTHMYLCQRNLHVTYTW
jgi:hypothetical protein